MAEPATAGLESSAAAGNAYPETPAAAIVRPAAHTLDYRPEIDGLRALAVAPVVLFHLGFTAMQGGFVGVDVFFVISGYLITSILKRALEGGAFSVIGFYERRGRRILPALIVVLVVTGWLSYQLLAPRELLGVADALVCVTLFASNIYFYFHAGYWDAAARDHPLLHTWSLGVEEQFYIVFPLLLAALHRWTGPTLRVWALLAMAALSLAMSAWAAGQAPAAGFYLSPFRAFELLIGALLAYEAAPAPRGRWGRELLSGAGLALIAGAVFAFSEATPFPGVAALVPCLGAAMVILSGAGGSSWAAGLLSTPPMVFVGRISYSLYLWHWPLIVFGRLWLSRPFSLPEKLLLLAGSVAAATLSWAFVERPFRRRSGRFPGRRTIFGMAIGAVVAAGFCAQQAWMKDGWPNRLPPTVNQIDAARRPDVRDGVCILSAAQRPSAWRQADCVIAGQASERVLWWGDSFAAQYVPALLREGGGLPFSVVQYNYAGCPPVFDFQPPIAPHCREFNDNVFKVISANHVRTVVLIGRWQAALRAGLGLPALTRTVQVLQAHGLKVIVVGQSPVFVGDAARIFAWRRLREPAQILAEPVVFAPTLNPSVNSAAAGAIFLDPMAALCRGQLCRLGEGRKPYFVDDGHMSLLGGQRVLPSLLEPIAAAAATNNK